MTSTFDPSLSATKDHIRLALGDTDTSSPLLADETINAKLASFPYSEALAQLAEALISQFGQKPDEYSESGGVRLKWSSRIDAWRSLVEAARAGDIPDPGPTRIARSGAAVGETTKQAMTPSTRRTVSTNPTLMEGFRSD